MSQYRCTICGFVFDEANGLADQGIPADTSWADVPADFVCPMCGAAKALFEPVAGTGTPSDAKPAVKTKVAEKMEWSAGQLAAICSNLAKGCEKQQLAEEKTLFDQLGAYFAGQVADAEPAETADIESALQADIDVSYPEAFAIAGEQMDRGALRALTWGEKVSKINNNLISRYQKQGSELLENTGIHVCEICGFVYLGDNLPDVCPVCKVPNFKITAIAR